MEKVLRKSLLCLGLIMLITLAFGQGNNIPGVVLYHGMYPMENVTASLQDNSGTIIATSTTNAQGFFEFLGAKFQLNMPPCCKQSPQEQ